MMLILSFLLCCLPWCLRLQLQVIFSSLDWLKTKKSKPVMILSGDNGCHLSMKGTYTIDRNHCSLHLEEKQSY